MNGLFHVITGSKYVFRHSSDIEAAAPARRRKRKSPCKHTHWFPRFPSKFRPPCRKARKLLIRPVIITLTLIEFCNSRHFSMTQEYLERIADYRVPEELDKINREFFLYSVEKGLVYEKITGSGSYNYIRNKLVDNVMSSTWGKTTWLQWLDPYKPNILLEFVQSASVEMYRRWVTDDQKIPLEEIIEISNQLLCSGVNGFVRKNIPI